MSIVRIPSESTHLAIVALGSRIRRARSVGIGTGAVRSET